MPAANINTIGNIVATLLCQISITPASVAANTSAEQTFSLLGAIPNVDFVNVTKPSLTAGISIGNARISAPGIIAITFTNSTASPIVPPAETYTVGVDRYANAGTSYPSTIT